MSVLVNTNSLKDSLTDNDEIKKGFFLNFPGINEKQQHLQNTLKRIIAGNLQPSMPTSLKEMYQKEQK